MQAEADGMKYCDPANIIRSYQTVGDVAVKAAGTPSAIPHAVVRRTIKAELRKDLTVSVADSEQGRPIGAVYAVRCAEVVQAVQRDREGVQPICRHAIVPTKAHVVGKIGVEKIAIQRRRERIGPAWSLLVAAAVREEELVFCAPVLVDAEGHRRIPYLLARQEYEIVAQAAGRVGLNCQEVQDLQSYGIERGSNLVSLKRLSALYWLSVHDNRCCRRRIRNLALQDRRIVVTRIGGPGGRPEKRGKIAV